MAVKDLLVNKQLKPGLGIIGFAVLVIIAVSSCGGNGAPGAITSPIAGGSAFGSPSGDSPAGSPSGSPVGSPTATISAVRATESPSRATESPSRTTAPASRTTAPPPHQTSAPVAVSSTPSGCYSLSNEGTCYEPGEFCRHTDHGASGIAGDGKRIVCEDNDGWRWEPV